MPPIKTDILDAIADAIEDVTGINQVIRNPSKPIDRDTARFDLAFVFDDDETNTDLGGGRVSRKQFPLQIEVWIRNAEGGEKISDLADKYQADINKILCLPSTPVNHRALILAAGLKKLTEISSSKFYADEDLGGVILLYEAQYHHKSGDLYDVDK